MTGNAAVTHIAESNTLCICAVTLAPQSEAQKSAMLQLTEPNVWPGKAGDLAMALQLFEELQSTKMKPDVWTYTSLINACQTCGNQWRQGIAFFQEMESQGEVAFFSDMNKHKLTVSYEHIVPSHMTQ